jgi:hypothetical protein
MLMERAESPGEDVFMRLKIAEQLLGAAGYKRPCIPSM